VRRLQNAATLMIRRALDYNTQCPDRRMVAAGTDWHDMHDVEMPRLQLAQQAG